MEGYLPQVMARMPLAEAVLTIWRWIADEKHLESLFERHRGRAYQRVLSFPLLVQLIADAIIQHGGSGRRSFERAKQAGTLTVSVQAAYGKLRRLPLPLSMGFLAECTDRLRDLFPEAAAHPLPPSLDNLQVVVLDGKAIKRVAKRLKPLRGVSGGVLGGRALVAMSLKSGLAVARHAHPDAMPTMCVSSRTCCRWSANVSPVRGCGWPIEPSATWNKSFASTTMGIIFWFVGGRMSVFTQTVKKRKKEEKKGSGYFILADLSDRTMAPTIK